VKARALVAVLLLAAAVRAPFWAFAGRASLDGDTAIVGLMARHPTRGTTLWGQPYGSPLDGWLAAPFVAALGPTPTAVRIPYALLALALVAAAYGIAERARAGAGRPAALLLACPPAYALLLSSLPPPLYPTTLALLGLLLLLALEAATALGEGRAPSRGQGAAIGLVAGLAAWTHLMSLATVAAVAVVLALRARRVPRALGRLGWTASAFAVASAPWWVRALGDPSATAVLGLAREGEPLLAHAAAVARRMHEPLSGLLGAWCPLTADEAERTVRAPLAVALLAPAAWLGLAALGLRATRHTAVAALMAGTVILTVAAYPFPIRSDEHTLRFLTPALLPLAVLAALGAVRLAGPRRAWMVVAPLCAAQLWTGARLIEGWRRAGPEALVPDCAPVLDALAGRGVTRAYASYHTAYCLTYTSGESLIASPPWNERFYGYPMPYLDEVRFDPRAAWVLVPGTDFELPAPRTFESKLDGIGGRSTPLRAGAARIYLDFVPPFGPRAAPGLVSGPAGDADVATRVVEPATGPATFALARPTSAAGITLLAGPSDPGLPRALDLEVSSDGSSFERIGRRRRGRETVDLAWINGHPQFLIDSLAFSVPLDGRTIVAVRVSPTEPGPWAPAEVLVHPAGGPGQPWPSADVRGAWAERRAALASERDPASASWLYRSLLALRHR
jgi:hypothetical protein